MDTSNQNQPHYRQPQVHQTIVVVGKRKSVGVAFLLALLFGPLGLLYASVTGGIVMFLIGLVIGIITFGFGLIFIWIGSIIWAVIEANNVNQKMSSGSGLNINTNFGGQAQRTQVHQPITNPTQQIQHEEHQKVDSSVYIEEVQAIPKPQLNLGTLNVQNPTPRQSTFDLGEWFEMNKKSVIVGAGFLVGILFLIVAIKFVFNIDFRNNKLDVSSTDNSYNSQPNQSINKENSTINDPVNNQQSMSNTTTTVPINNNYATVVTNDFLALKVAPDINSKRLLKIYNNEVVYIVSQTSTCETISGIYDCWYKVNYNGIEGYVFGGYLHQRN